MNAPERTTMNGKPVHFRPAKTVLNMDSGFRHKLLCDGPTFSAGDACAYSCAFCYVPDQARKLLQPLGITKTEADHAGVVVRRTNAVDILEKQIRALPEAVRTSQLTLYMSHWVDVAANMDLVSETLEVCAVILAYTQWHIRMLSKSNLLPKIAKSFARDQDYKARLIFGVSTGTLDDNLASAFEQGCPKVSKRIESLHWLQDEGFRTFGMVCPSLPMRDDYAIVRDAYQKWSAAIMDAIRADRCEHVWAEVLNVRGESMVRTCKALHAAGYEWQAAELERVSTDKAAWEDYARKTFLAHACRTDLLDEHGHSKLRFLQYVTKDTAQWWHEHRTHGAIPLGAAALHS